MSEQYSEQDTERARQAERSSAGQQTQQLGLPGGVASYPTTTPVAGNRPNMIGLVLVGLGALLLLGRMVTLPLELEGGMVLLTIASVFYFFGFWRRIYGLIIPGSILAGLSVGVTFADLTNGVSVLWGLSLGFLAIYALGNTMFRMRSPWPVIPAVILFAVGSGVIFADLTNGVSVLWGLSLGFLAIYALGNTMFRMRSPWPVIPAVILFAVGSIVAISSLPTFLSAGMIWLPLLLVGAGLYLGWMRKP